jgi:hypothetical protein
MVIEHAKLRIGTWSLCLCLQHELEQTNGPCAGLGVANAPFERADV